MSRTFTDYCSQGTIPVGALAACFEWQSIGGESRPTGTFLSPETCKDIPKYSQDVLKQFPDICQGSTFADDRSRFTRYIQTKLGDRAGEGTQSFVTQAGEQCNRLNSAQSPHYYTGFCDAVRDKDLRQLLSYCGGIPDLENLPASNSDAERFTSRMVRTLCGEVGR
jgi:hypothetical protein